MYDYEEEDGKRKKNMKTKNILLISLLALVGYIAVLKLVGLKNIDFSDLFNSLKPMIPHTLALMGAFIANLFAYLKGHKGAILAAELFCILSAISYLPMSLGMLVPAALIIFAYTKTEQ